MATVWPSCWWWSAGLPVFSLPSTAQRSTTFCPLYRPKGHTSPLRHDVFFGSDFGPAHCGGVSVEIDPPRSIAPEESPQPPYPKNLPMVAFLPSSATTNGWVWIRPSWWEWIPALPREFGLLAGFSNAGAGSSHSPQMSTFNAVCQWSPAVLVVASGA